ncbi:polysaccharide pyruvyl transferase family protein [Pseudooceanicola sp. LIPI14-2-Ac024]|uniref:polysaccharide pyruvyl transferase family protein n=1 Tax=Pseudooceanicola sp. LIPI14-2-Ac024 TaxID=3344875 RepID=UPI0035CF9279
MKIVQFGVGLSPNLGDGVIADCLAYGLKARRQGITVTCVDISGRTARGEQTVANRRLAMALLDHLPRPLRHAIARRKLEGIVDRVAGDWTRAVQDADLAVIGGGQIFSDANLNFPVKIGRAAGILAAAGTPTAVYAVGVSGNWSDEGRDRFARVLDCDLRLVGTRDNASAMAWDRQMPGGPAPQLTADPGLLAAPCYGPPGDAAEGIGLCITDFAVLRHHADGRIAGQGSSADAFYAGIVEALVAGGHRVTLFCNGATEDAAQMARLAALPRLAALAADGRLTVLPLATTPRELALQIAGCRAVIAHRLHACIVAYSYGRPVVGLGWDSKLRAFFDAVGLGESFCDRPDINGAGIAALATAAIDRGIGRDDHATALGRAWSGIDLLLESLTPPGAG